MKNRYSPAVLRLAQEHDIDLEKVNGTGAFGRITRKDVLKLIEAGNIPKKGSLIQETKSYKSPKTAGDTEIPVSGVRKAIAQNMARSKTEIPHAWMMIEVDVTGLVELRNSIKEEFKAKEGFPLTFFPFFVKSVAEALKEYPQMNSTWAGDKIIQKKDINISIAVATDDALYVPVIKHADEKSIKGIAREINELALKVRTGTIEAKEMEGGTFTVNNTGSFGSIQSMGIINYPQAALLQVETIVKRLVVMKNGMIAVRDMVNLCLSLDHRVLDGVVCGRFLQRVKQILEGISKETTSVY
jgi:2-oxoisovalerate dehydrogenase E2 component (dihydrolipoyl transacylase)